MKILLANKNVWWKAGGVNQPGYKTKTIMVAQLIKEHFPGMTANLNQAKDVTPIKWSSDAIVANIDKSALKLTKNGKYLEELLQSNYAVVQTSPTKKEFYFVNEIVLNADMVTVSLSRDIWVNDMSWRDGLNQEVFVEREHADRFELDASGTPIGFNYVEGSPVHNYEDMSGMDADQLVKKIMINPHKGKLSGLMNPPDPSKLISSYYSGGTTDTDKMSFGILVNELEQLKGGVIDEDKLKAILIDLVEYTFGKQKWLRAYVRASKTESDPTHGWVTRIGEMAELPMGVMVAPASTGQGRRHSLVMHNGGSVDLYNAMAPSPDTLGFQVITYPEVGVIEGYLKSYHDGEMVLTSSVWLDGTAEVLLKVLAGEVKAETWFELITNKIELQWDSEKYFRTNEASQAQNIATMYTNDILVHPFDAAFIGISGTVTEGSFEPKLNNAPFASYNIGSSVNEGSNIELNRFYNEPIFGVRSLTSLSPESTSQRIYIGTILSHADSETLDYNIGAYKNTDQTSIGAHWNNPFYPPTITDEWASYINEHKSSVISGAIVQTGNDIGKFGMSMAAGALTGGPVGAIMGGISGAASMVSGQANFWSHRADMQKAPQKINEGGSEWSVAANIDLAAYFKVHGLLKSDEAIVLRHLNSFGYAAGKLKKVDFKTRTRYNYIKINDQINPGFFPNEELSPAIVQVINDLLNGGVRIWHHGAPGNLLDYGTENWEVTVAKGN